MPPNPPASSFAGAVDALVKSHQLSPPPRLGVLARVERYEILRLLGTGGMGTALLARDPNAPRQVVVKLLRADLLSDSRLVRRFLAEAQFLKELQHPNIITVLEIADSIGCPFFVMPFAEKGSLAHYLKGARPVEPARLFPWAQQLAEALEYAHRKGITHRDIKPSNVLFDAEDRVLLADFGLARSFANESGWHLKAGQYEGTAPYMSPLLAKGEAEDTRCDIYAFGAVLYEMLTGRPPYQGKTKEVLQQILDGPPQPIVEINPGAPAGLVAIAEAAMARAHRDRYATMGDIVLDLTQTARGLAPMGPHALWQPKRYGPAAVLGAPRLCAP